MPLTSEAKAQALEALFGGNLFWVGLASSILRRLDGSLAIDEDTDPGYRRQQVYFTPPAQDPTLPLTDASEQVNNVEVVRFPSTLRGPRPIPAFWFISDNATAGVILAYGPTQRLDSEPAVLSTGDEVFFKPGSLVISLADTKE